ncbi:hypothetical protein PENTCL1PPCAC_12544, partial [Pristionchus entomophagus]
HDLLKEMMVDSFFLDLTRSCNNLHLYECEKITSESIHQMYKVSLFPGMIEGSTKLRQFSIVQFSNEKCLSFLELIGITYRDHKFFSNKYIQVFSPIFWTFAGDVNAFLTHIFDGYLEMVF